MQRESITPLTLKALTVQIWGICLLFAIFREITPVPCSVASHRENEDLFFDVEQVMK